MFANGQAGFETYQLADKFVIKNMQSDRAEKFANLFLMGAEK